MTDDYLTDFERELHAAARRRASRGRSPRRWLAPAFAAATAAAAVAFVLAVAGPDERELEVPPVAGPAPAGQIDLPALAPRIAAGCEPRRRDLDVADFPLSVLRRTQHSPDALAVDELPFAAADYDPDATRAPTGIGERVVLSPTSGVGCRGDEPGVCLIAHRGSRCFTLEEITAGRAVVLVDPRVAVGIVADGIESVALEGGGERHTATVVENAFRVELPSMTGSVHVELIAKAHDGCAPSAAMRRAVPALDKEPANGGVPPAIRSAFGADSAVIGRHARIWGGGDGVTYWVVPRLRCDGFDQDLVCVTPLLEGDERKEGGGGSACGALDQLGRTFMSFPLRDGQAAVTGLAPENATAALVRTDEPNFEMRFDVKDGVWAGSLGRREIRELQVRFDARASSAPRVAVLNGTTVTGLGQTVMDALVDVNYRRTIPGVGDWREHDLVRSFVYHAPGKEWLGERIATYVRERFGSSPLEVREMTDEVRELIPDDAEAVVVAGRDLAD